MGLLLCLAGFALSFGALLTIGMALDVFLHASKYVDPENAIAGEWEVLALLGLMFALLALVGARFEQRWLNDHRALAVRSGAIAGTATALTWMLFGIAWTWAPPRVAAAILAIARLTFLLCPAVITYLVIRSTRRREEFRRGEVSSSG